MVTHRLEDDRVEPFAVEELVWVANFIEVGAIDLQRTATQSTNTASHYPPAGLIKTLRNLRLRTDNRTSTESQFAVEQQLVVWAESAVVVQGTQKS